MERLNPINMSLEPTDPLKERSIIFCRQVGNITDMHDYLTISLDLLSPSHYRYARLFDD